MTILPHTGTHVDAILTKKIGAPIHHMSDWRRARAHGWFKRGEYWWAREMLGEPLARRGGSTGAPPLSAPISKAAKERERKTSLNDDAVSRRLHAIVQSSAVYSIRIDIAWRIEFVLVSIQPGNFSQSAYTIRYALISYYASFFLKNW